MTLLRNLTLIFAFTALSAFGQWSDFCSLTSASNLCNAMNFKQTFQLFAGNPNTHVAGTIGKDRVYDTVGNIEYICTSTGSTSTAVWSQSSLGVVTNDVQTKATVMPNTAPAAGRVPVGNAGGTAYAAVAVSGDGTLASTGVLAVSKVNGVTISGTPSAGYVPVASSPTAAAWTALGTARDLSGAGVSAKCQSAVAAAGFSLPSAAAPTATCESDNIQAYLAFTANTAQTAYDRFTLPANWSGVLKIMLSAYSTSTSAPTIAVQLSCISTGATASPTYGTAQTISLTPGATSGRTAVSTTLTTTLTFANKACAAGDMVAWKLAITAAAAADLNVLSVKFTE